MSLSIIVPVYNEEDCIEECIRQLCSVFPGDEFEVIIVNDGSTDATAELLAKNKESYGFQLVSYPENKGYASAIHEGIKVAKNEYFTIFDADLQVKAKDIHRMYRTASENNLDLVVGEPESKGYHLLRSMVSRGYNMLVRIMFHIKVRDINSPKIVRKSMLSDVKLAYGHAMIDVEILAYAFAKKASHTGVSYTIQQRYKGESKFNVMLIPRTLIDLIRLKIKIGV
ncbi:MAG: glycosyltransferase family 2 protein [Candidatus Altiarchaeota archaeon]